MTDLTQSPIRDLIAQLARIEDIRRVTPTHPTRNTPGAPTSTVAALELAEQDIIEELRRPGRPRPGLYGPQGTASHPYQDVLPPNVARPLTVGELGIPIQLAETPHVTSQTRLE